MHSVRQRYRGPRMPRDRRLTTSSRRGSPTRSEPHALSIAFRGAIDSATVYVDMGDREEIADFDESDSDVDATREVQATVWTVLQYYSS